MIIYYKKSNMNNSSNIQCKIKKTGIFFMK